ncbi:MAG TPA: AI-2E family transporter [Methanocorpusculum sp.]|nr:AI-2E family transporter [Methanocorpusculum sp.]
MNLAYFLKNHTTLVLLAIFLIIVTIISWKFLGVVIIAASLAVVGMPLFRRLKSKLPTTLSATIVTVLICAIIVAILTSIAVILSKNITTLGLMFESIGRWAANLLNIEFTAGSGFDLAETITSVLTPEIALSAISLTSFIIICCVLFFAILYLFFIFGEKIVDDIVSIIPEQSLSSMLMMGKKTKEILFALYIVHVLIAVITFLVAIPYGLLLGVGFDTVLFIATLCGVFALIPVVGPIIVIIFIGIFCISMNNWYGLIITVTVGYFLTCVLTDIILRPRLTAKSVKIRPMLMFIGFFGGAAIMGLLGFVLGPVLLVIAMTGYEVFFKEMRDVKKEIDSAQDGVRLLEPENKQ